MIALENFVVFCHTSTGIRRGHPHVFSLPSPSPSCASRLSPGPCLSSESQRTPTAIHFTDGPVNVCVTMSIHLPFSLLSSHHVHRSVLSLFLHCCPENKFISAISLDSYMCVSIQYFYFCFWLISLCIIGSSFVHLVRTDSDTFLFVAELYSIVYMYHASVSIHLLISFWSLLMPVGCEMRDGVACLPSLFMVGWGVRWGRWKCNAKGQAKSILECGAAPFHRFVCSDGTSSPFPYWSSFSFFKNVLGGTRS